MKRYSILKRRIGTSDWTANELSKALQMSGGKFSGLVNGTYKGYFTKHQKTILAGLLERSEKYLFQLEIRKE